MAASVSTQHPILIEQENTDGDRRVVEKIDTQGLPQGTVILDLVKARCAVALEAPAVYRVRALQDNGTSLRRVWTVTA